MSDWLEKVHAHADGELSETESEEVQALLFSNPSAAAEHHWAVYLRQSLLRRHLTPDHSEAWQASLERLDAIDALRGDGRVGSFVGKFSWGFAACLLSVILFAGFLNRGTGPGQISDQQLAGLFTAQPPVSGRSVEGVDDADAFVRREIGVRLPDIHPVFNVLRVGKGAIDSRTFLRVDLEDHTGSIALFIFEGTSGFEGFEPVPGRNEFFGGKINGQTCVGWSEGEFAYAVVCDRSTDETVGIADQMRR